MGFKDELKALIAKSLKAGDKARTSTLRMLLSDITNKEIALRRAVEGDEALQVVKTMIRQRRDSVEQYEKGGREELAMAETAEIKILEEFMPAQLSADEIETLVKDTITELKATSMKDMGKVMKAVMAGTQGRADGKAVQEAVKKALGA